MIKPVNYEPSQHFGDNPTSVLPADHWLIKRFGNYQPDGHTGIDYPCPAGTPVKAVTAGTVLHVGWFGGTYLDNPYWISPGFAGYCYVVDHGSFVGIYAHCLDGGARVKVGQHVAEGQILGPSGNTGGSTGDHLHFETLPDGWVVNSRMYGRVNPFTILAQITPQSTTIKPIEEDTLSAAEKDEIIRAVRADGAKTRKYIKDLAYSGWLDEKGKKHPGFMLVIEEEQRRAADDRVNLPKRIAAAVWGTVVKRSSGRLSVLQDLVNGASAAMKAEPAVVEILEHVREDDKVEAAAILSENPAPAAEPEKEEA